MARPTIYTDELGAEICRRLADGESLLSICKADEMPARSTVVLWSNDKEHPFSDSYAEARLQGYQKMAEELLDIADDGSNDWMERHDPNNPGYSFNGEHSQRSRLRLDTRKWLLAKCLPKMYGDKMELTGKDGEPLFKVYKGIDETLMG